MVIDVATILADSKGLIKFITDIIGFGSSERSAFSAVVYGDNLPVNQRIKMVTLLSTQPTMSRKKAEQEMTADLLGAFKNIKMSKGEEMRSVSLLTAFKIATGESRPDAMGRGSRKKRLGYAANDGIIGNHDNQQVR